MLPAHKPLDNIGEGRLTGCVQLFDKVLYNRTECFIFGRRTRGSFDIRKLNGEKINAGISYKKLSLLEKRTTQITERSRRFLPMAKARGIRA